MKVLTTAQMREVDRHTIEMGIPGIVLMENAAHRVVEFLADRCAPLAGQLVVAVAYEGTSYMKVLTTAQMREVDRRSIEIGIPGIVLMENAAHRVVEFLADRCAPLAGQLVVARRI
jgi:NAD(P)H-hydrate repair Nnr-like enzyme with NAD(P)H-hydrate epimerase domain